MESARRKRRRNDDCEEELVPSFLVHSAQTKLQVTNISHDSFVIFFRL